MQAQPSWPEARVLEIVCCPITRQGLRPMTPAELVGLNQAIEAEPALERRDGTPVEQAATAALITEDGAYAYPVDDGIYCLLAGSAISLAGVDSAGPSATGGASRSFAASKKAEVQAFYDEVGWQKVDGVYVDTALFSYGGDAVDAYRDKCWHRVRRSLPAEGRYLLDVASGPRPVATHEVYAQSFAHHVCIDVSVVALRNAQGCVGGRGIYILGDITNLPLRTGTMDAAVSLHTIYHVPKDEQAEAFRELHRVLKPGGKASVAYSWGKHAPLPHLPTLPVTAFRMLRKRLARAQRGGAPGPESLYFHGHSYRWFTRQDWPFEYEIRVLRSPNRHFLNLYIHRRLGGERFLELLYRSEERFPELAGRLGCYPLIVIEKRAAH
jgi:ubiquinone/menaquinone biosynthesis C-methylase UbiE/uncharacterized protein YbaR (Trm112 family)